MDLFKLLGTIVIKNSDANKALDETSEKGEKTQSKLGKAFSVIGKGALGVATTVAAGMAAVGTAMGALTVKALNLSGELEQNMGGSEQVFKEHANKMQETAKGAFEKMGLSTSEFLATANKMGALFQGAGFDIQESADLSSKAMQRAADVASIMGIDTASAMEAIAGAAKGNFTMMDNLGVAMNDTAIQNYALAKGIDKTTSEMTQQEKIGLAMEMFMEKTAYAAGNYAKENETLAGALGTAKAALTNFLDGSGDVEQLVTAFSNAADVVVRNLETIAPRLVSGITDIVNKITPKLPPLFQKILPVIVKGATDLINGLASNLPQLVAILTTAILPQLLSGLTTILTTLVEALPQAVDTLLASLPELLPAIIDALFQIGVAIAENLFDILAPVFQRLPEIASSVATGLVDSFNGLSPQMKALAIAIAIVTAAIKANEIANKLKAIAVAAGMAAEGSATVAMGLHAVAANVATAATTALGAAMAFLTSPVTLVVIAIAALIAIVVLCVKYWDEIKWAGEQAWKGIKKAWSSAGQWFKDVWKSIKNAFSSVGSWFKTTFTNAKNSVVNAFSNVKEKLTAPFEKAKEKIKEIADKIKGFFSGEIKMPKIKKPSFSVSPKGWEIGDLLKGVIPKLSIKWNAKGAILKEPTLFGYNPATGTIQGGGEAGDEAVAPIDTLQQYVKGAVAGENTGIVARLDRIIDLLVRFFPDMLEALDVDMYLDGDVLVAETAPKFDNALGKIAINKGRGR